MAQSSYVRHLGDAEHRLRFLAEGLRIIGGDSPPRVPRKPYKPGRVHIGVTYAPGGFRLPYYRLDLEPWTR